MRRISWSPDGQFLVATNSKDGVSVGPPEPAVAWQDNQKRFPRLRQAEIDMVPDLVSRGKAAARDGCLVRPISEERVNTFLHL